MHLLHVNAEKKILKKWTLRKKITQAAQPRKYALIQYCNKLIFLPIQSNHFLKNIYCVQVKIRNRYPLVSLLDAGPTQHSNFLKQEVCLVCVTSPRTWRPSGYMAYFASGGRAREGIAA